jgi:hypothetical protein
LEKIGKVLVEAKGYYIRLGETRGIKQHAFRKHLATSP